MAEVALINEIKPESSNTEENKKDTEWEVKEKCLLDRILKLETISNDQTTKIQNLEHDIQQRTEERENYKNKVQILENEIKELKNQQPNMLNPAQQNEVDKIKKKSEEILVRAKGVIFEKTKMCKHQELQIEGLNEQVSSLKEVLSITKDLLEIRNLEVKHLQEQMDNMDQKIKTEKVRHELMNKKMDAIIEMNKHLKNEHDEQIKLFHQLRDSYAEREVLQNETQNNP